ncbi:MAG TPA: alpha/beta hydrolase [Streptosporangiaceae bacterium]
MAAAAFCGHSYGAWLALSYARHSPVRVTRLALPDPTSCFAGLRLSYRLRAVPVLARPGADRARGFLEWEAGGMPLEPLSLALACGGAEFRGSKIVMPRRPKPAELQAMSVPALVLLAAESKAHDIRRVGASAERLLPHVTVGVLPGASHHSLPATSPDRLNQELAAFLG